MFIPRRRAKIRARVGLLIAALGALFGCPPPPGGDDNPLTARYWAKSYGGPHADEARSVVQAADGGYIFAGTSEALRPGDSDAWVTKLDSAGNVQWSKRYGDNRLGLMASESAHVQPTPDGGYIVAGSVGGEVDQDIGVVKLDARGFVQWRASYDGDYQPNQPDSGRIYNRTLDKTCGIQTLPGGGYLVLGLATPGLQDEERSFYYDDEMAVLVLALNARGEVLWRDFSGEPPIAFHATPDPPAFHYTADGGAVLIEPYARDDDEEVSLFWRLAGGGGLLWEREFDSDAPSPARHTAFLRGVLQTDDDNDGQADDGFIAVGQIENSEFVLVNEYDFWLLKLDGQGNVAWELQIDGTGGAFDGETLRAVDQAFLRFGGGRAGAWIVAAGVAGEPRDFEQSAWIGTFHAITGDAIGELHFGRSGVAAGTINVHVLSVTAIDDNGDGDDDGYVVAGWTQPQGGDPQGWIAKLTGYESISLQWDAVFDLHGEGLPQSIERTADGGFIATGGRWLTKLNADGSVEWRKSDYDETPSTAEDVANAIVQTDDNGDGVADGAYIFAGHTTSFGAGGRDAWVVKLRPEGEPDWQKTYGGSDDEQANAIAQTPDGGYVMAGQTRSFGQGSGDAWLLRLDADGNVLWQKTYGTAVNEGASGVLVLPDGDMMVAGFMTGSSIDTLPWMLRVAADGTPLWQYTYDFPPGVLSNLEAKSIGLSSDGRVLVGVSSRIGTFGWTLTLDGDGTVTRCENHHANTRGAGAAPDGSLISFAGVGNQGASATTGDILIRKLDARGASTWQWTYGGQANEQAHSGRTTSDGGCIVAGLTDSITASRDAWLLRLDAEGVISPSCPSGVGVSILEEAEFVFAEAHETTVAGVDSVATVSDTNAPGFNVEDLLVTRQCFGGEDQGPQDNDFDGVQDEFDNCPNAHNPGQLDGDGDGVGDYCDNCLNTHNPDQLDSDADHYGDRCDNCPNIHNPDQLDGDRDDDGVPDCTDGCPDDPLKRAAGGCGCGNPETSDCAACPDGDDDDDGVCNSADRCPGADDNLDSDADGVPNCIDNCAGAANPDQLDGNANGVGDACEPVGFHYVDPAMSGWIIHQTRPSGEVEYNDPENRADGQGNPDPYRRMVVGLGPAASFEAVHLPVGLSLPWSPPGLNGRTLDHVDLAIDQRRLDPLAPGPNVGGGFVIVQSDAVYKTTAAPVASAAWTTDRRDGLRAIDFTDDLGRHPDFSAGAGIMGFGYYRTFTTTAAFLVISIEAVDNFTITAVPAP